MPDSTSRIFFSKQTQQLADFVKKHLETAPKCHDWDHTLRVLTNARKIQLQEGGNLEIIEVAAIFHDFCRPEEMKMHGSVCHAELGSKAAYQILPKFGYTDEDFIQHVADAVLTHRYRTSNKPKTIEAKIIFDADKLDSIGAIGVGRAFHFAGRFGARVHNSKADALNGDSYGIDDSAYREYLIKLQNIHEKLYTKTGREMSDERHQFMVNFFDRLNNEVGL